MSAERDEALRESLGPVLAAAQTDAAAGQMNRTHWLDRLVVAADRAIDQPTLAVGMKITGYANGYFGKGSYGDKVIIACGVWGSEGWAVAIEGGEHLVMAQGFDGSDVARWLAGEET